jgi:hypothetical protein
MLSKGSISAFEDLKSEIERGVDYTRREREKGKYTPIKESIQIYKRNIDFSNMNINKVKSLLDQLESKRGSGDKRVEKIILECEELNALIEKEFLEDTHKYKELTEEYERELRQPPSKLANTPDREVVNQFRPSEKFLILHAQDLSLKEYEEYKTEYLKFLINLEDTFKSLIRNPKKSTLSIEYEFMNFSDLKNLTPEIQIKYKGRVTAVLFNTPLQFAIQNYRSFKGIICDILKDEGFFSFLHLTYQKPFTPVSLNDRERIAYITTYGECGDNMHFIEEMVRDPTLDFHYFRKIRHSEQAQDTEGCIDGICTIMGGTQKRKRKNRLKNRRKTKRSGYKRRI